MKFVVLFSFQNSSFELRFNIVKIYGKKVLIKMYNGDSISSILGHLNQKMFFINLIRYTVENGGICSNRLVYCLC